MATKVLKIQLDTLQIEIQTLQMENAQLCSKKPQTMKEIDAENEELRVLQQEVDELC